MGTLYMVCCHDNDYEIKDNQLEKAHNACCVIAPQLLQATKTTGTEATGTEGAFKTGELRLLKSFSIGILEYPSNTEKEHSPHL